jgi:hypothetical protein
MKLDKEAIDTIKNAFGEGKTEAERLALALGAGMKEVIKVVDKELSTHLRLQEASLKQIEAIEQRLSGLYKAVGDDKSMVETLTALAERIEKLEARAEYEP